MMASPIEVNVSMSHVVDRKVIGPLRVVFVMADHLAAFVTHPLARAVMVTSRPLEMGL